MEIFVAYTMLAFFVFVIVGAIAFCVSKVFRWSSNNHSEVIKQEVTLEEKIEKHVILGASPEKGLSGPSSPKRYYLIFKTKEGKSIRCEVPESRFISVKEGNKGILTMQGARFISFDKS